MTDFVGTATFTRRGNRKVAETRFVTVTAHNERMAKREAKRKMIEQFDLAKSAPIKINMRQATHL